MSRPLRYALLGALVALSVMVIAACGDDDDTDAIGGATATETASATATETATATATEISVELDDFSVAPDPSSTSHGEITFAVQNTSSTPHDFVVIRTDLAPDALPVEGAAVDESQLDVVLRIDDIAGGESSSEAAELDPGSYVLICNVPGHYGLGMTAELTIE